LGRPLLKPVSSSHTFDTVSISSFDEESVASTSARIIMLMASLDQPDGKEHVTIKMCLKLLRLQKPEQRDDLKADGYSRRPRYPLVNNIEKRKNE
jgi:hypothetical protein